jgi:hypothetical protein
METHTMTTCQTFTAAARCGITGTRYALVAAPESFTEDRPEASAPRLPRNREELRLLVEQRQAERDLLAVLMVTA